MSIAFVVNVWRDDHLAGRLLDQLQHHFPTDQKIVIPDTDQLKRTSSGAWTKRYLDAALKTDADTIIKLDPDSCVWRPFTVPKADWFGTISKSRAFIRGGCCGFSRAAAEKVVNSPFILESDGSCYQRYGNFKWPHEEFSAETISLQDVILGKVMRRLNVSPTNWDEVFILGNHNKVPEVHNFAVTHPHPILP